MAVMPDGFELETFLAPIEGASLVGRDLREDFSPQSFYYRLRDARAEARAAERSADSDGGDEQSPPQWRTVRELASQAIQTETKDLEIAAWYTEALVRSDGVVGLTAGAMLIEGLTRNFWDAGVFPLPDEDGISTRVAPITGLNGQGSDGTLIQPLRKIAMCRRPTGETLYYYQYEDAGTVAGIADMARKQARLSAGSLLFDDVENWCRAAGQAHFAVQKARVADARAAWVAMSDVLDEKAGSDSPATSRVRDLMGDILAAVSQYAPSERGEPAAGGAAEAAVPVTSFVNSAAGGFAAAAPQGRVVTREDMLRELSRIADWFRTAEPTSPLSQTLDDAVRRARMTLPQLLAELVDDMGSRNAILSSLGIKPPEPE
jgi:type VI secretion system protein ImpA